MKCSTHASRRHQSLYVLMRVFDLEMTPSPSSKACSAHSAKEPGLFQLQCKGIFLAKLAKPRPAAVAAIATTAMSFSNVAQLNLYGSWSWRNDICNLSPQLSKDTRQGLLSAQGESKPIYTLRLLAYPELDDSLNSRQRKVHRNPQDTSGSI